MGSERTESSRTWALPSGASEVEQAGGVVRFRDEGATATGGWRDVDTTLARQSDGSVAPRAVPGVTVLSGGGAEGTLVTSTDPDGRGVSLGAGSAVATLPTPTLQGSTATYPEVRSGVDLRVEVRPAGFESLWVIKNRAGLDKLLADESAGDVLGLTAPLTLSKASAGPADTETVKVSDAKGRGVGRFAPPTMWDAKIDPASGEPMNRKAVRFGVSAAGKTLSPTDPAKTGRLALTVNADGAWLRDPARAFPITIDPTYAQASTGPVFDTYVQEGSTVDNSDSAELRIGLPSYGDKARTFLNFSQGGFAGKTITSASLRLREVYAGTCAARGWSAWNAGAASTSSRWTTPPWIGSKYAVATESKGNSSSCPAGDVSIDMKTQLQLWADETSTTRGLLLRAESETDTSSWKRFASSETSTPPVLRYTYNRAPGAMAVPSLAPATTYKPAGSSTSYLYTSSTKPTLSGVVPADGDGDVMRGRFYAFADATTANGNDAVSYCSNYAYVAGGTTASCALATALTANGSYWVRARAQDSNAENGPYSAGREIRIASVTPAPPAISCPGLTNNTWTTTGPSTTTACTVAAVGSGYSAPSAIKWAVDGKAWTTTAITQSASAATAKITASVPSGTGGHKIAAYAINPAGLTSGQAVFQTGWGTASLDAPRPTPMTTTTDTVAVAASGPPRGRSGLPAAKVQWRVAGATGTAGWKDAPAGTSFAVTDAAGATKATATFDTTLLVGQADASAVTVAERTSTLLDLRVCLGYDSGTQCTGSTTVQRVPHAYGSGFPEADAGPGRVALWTGELSVSDTDAELATPDGGLSVSRSHNSFAGPSAIQNRVFGPGWTASFDGDDSGAGGAELWDNTFADGTLAVADSDGGLLLFKTPGATPGLRRGGASLATGPYLPADDDTAAAGVTLTVSGTGASTVVELKDDDGIVTRFQVTAAPVTNQPAVFKTVEVREPAAGTKTTYSYDAAGRVAAIVAALPDGVSTCAPGTPSPGCRVLKISYATATAATATTPGDFVGQVKQISAQVNTDPDRPLASYRYDVQGRLVSVTDVRVNLSTGYTWTGSGTGLRLATLTPPGQAGYTFDYAANKLSRVSRPNPGSAGGGTAQLGAYVYGVPLAGTVPGLPDLAVEVDRWGQDRDPTWAAAVFGPDTPIGAAPAAGSAAWQAADLQFTDGQGYTLNTASYGAGDWQLTAADYDVHGNVVRAWDERAIAGIRDGSLAPGAAARDVATVTVYNDDIVSGGVVVTPAGSLVTDVYGPVYNVADAGGGVRALRTHTKTTFDQGAPNGGVNPDRGQPYRLPTKAVTTAEAADGTVADTLSVSLTGYEALVAGDKSGWALGQATSATVDMDQSGSVTSGDITSRTRYDERGRTVESRQPKSDGSDAGTRVTAFYTGAGSGPAGCAGKPEWAGLTCRVGPAAQPSGQSMPTSKTTGYTWDGQPTVTVDTSGGVTSTTTTGFDAQDRPVSAATSVSGLAGSAAVPVTTTSYDPATGLVTGTSSSAGSTGMAYDTWGRQVSYTNTPTGQPADAAATTFDAAGRVVSVVDGNGQTVYGYDGTDAAGKVERRGLVTSVKVQVSGGSEYTSTGGYDPAGELTMERLPGNLIRRTSVDVAGEQTGLAVNGQAVDPNTGVVAADQPWLGWSTTSNAQGQTVAEYTPDGGSTGAAGGASRGYTYDRAGRLTRVQDRTGVPDAAGVVPCQTRTYSFDGNGNRTGQDSVPAAAGGGCGSSGGAPVTRAYDAADRPTSSGNGAGSYGYDPLGRQLTIPAADAPHPAEGNVTVGYDDTDAARSITQGGQTTTFTLDGAGRRLGQTGPAGTLVRHYTDSGDDPTWSVDTRGGTSTTTRYAELVGGDLGLTLSTTGGVPTAELAVATPRGDVAATVSLGAGMTGPAATPAAGIDRWNSYTEYGAPQQAHDASGPGGTGGIGYGWLGAKQRATLDTGLTLMGARLYNQATGLFTSTDPVYSGGDTTYGYPNDPINSSDLSGNWWHPYRRYVAQPFSRAIGRFTAWRARRTGGSCYWSGGLRVCTGSRSRLARRGGTTYGNTYITRSRSANSGRIKHEDGHRRQWFRQGPAMILGYAAASIYSYARSGTYWNNNWYERHAGGDGGYRFHRAIFPIRWHIPLPRWPWRR